MTHLLLVGMDELLQGIIIPIAISLVASLVRIAIWGWRGSRHFAATLCTGCFAGVMAHWILAHFAFDPTINAVIISFSALLSRDALALIFNRRNMARARQAIGQRMVDEILHRCRPREE